jgi:putative acetyltransferase
MRPRGVGDGVVREGLLIRPETASDIVAIRAVNEAAFEGAAEADIVDALRGDADPFISLVAEREGEIVGHICFSPVTIGDSGHVGYVGLGPMAVRPDVQRRGIGSALVVAGLDECRRRGQTLVVVVGHPEFYPRFGFHPASRLGLTCEYDVPDDVFMVFPLAGESPAGGIVRYHAAFGSHS